MWLTKIWKVEIFDHPAETWVGLGKEEQLTHTLEPLWLAELLEFVASHFKINKWQIEINVWLMKNGNLEIFDHPARIALDIGTGIERKKKKRNSSKKQL